MLSRSEMRAGSRRNGGWLGSRVVGPAPEQGSGKRLASPHCPASLSSHPDLATAGSKLVGDLLELNKKQKLHCHFTSLIRETMFPISRRFCSPAMTSL